MTLKKKTTLYCVELTSYVIWRLDLGGKALHTLTDWSGIRIVPGSIDLATNDPLSLVVVSWVTYKHHDSIVLVLGSIYQPPSPVFHSRVANVGTSHRWKGQRSNKVSENLSWSFTCENYQSQLEGCSWRKRILTETSGRGLGMAPPPRFLTCH